ncbi:UDP-N-acetylmuramoyl-L-alanine--D-glutamate ligase [Vibrio sp. WJH972]
MDRWQSIKNVVVVGLGVTGLSVVNYLHRYQPGTAIRVIDTRDTPPGQDDLPPGIELHSGSWQIEWLLNADLVVVNPGIALATPEIQMAIDHSILVVGDIELFAWHVEKPVIAITGSNGKSTVTDLCGVLARAAGFNVGVGGNIGVPALDLIDDRRDLYILELSSFQLETTSSLVLTAAAFLNLSEDHMDRYEGMLDYRQAKLRIFEDAQCAVVNQDDSATFPDTFSNDVIRFSVLESKADFSLVTSNECEYLAKSGEPLIATNELKLVGRHNLANALTALALLSRVNISLERCRTALMSYTGLTHRCQVVVDNQGVKWVNDSKATNVASTLAALSGLDCTGTLYLLVGGVGKGADFSPLAPALAALKVKLCCFGRDGEQFMSLHSQSVYFPSMDEAIVSITPQLVAGDIVMLSPACASFDQFNNFMHRGDYFSRLAAQYA